MTSIRTVVTLGAALVVGACHDAGEEHEPKAVVSVRTIVVAPRAFSETLGAIGVVVARADRVATLSAPAAGRVAQVLVKTGQIVQQGQVLVVLDAAPFQAALQAADAALNAAQRASDRQQRLANEGIIPRKDAEAAAAEVAAKRADVVVAQRNAELATLHAPIAGVVTRMLATIGGSADPSQPLVEIADPSALDILLSTTPTDAGRVQPGNKVTLAAGVTPGGEPVGVGTVADVGAMVDSSTRGVTIRVQAPTTRRPLRIGETIFGNIVTAVHPNALVVPADALVPDGDAFKVFVVDTAGVAHERAVTVGAQNADGAQIVGGLRAGERVVTYGAYGVTDSAHVQIMDAAAGSAPPVPRAAKP